MARGRRFPVLYWLSIVLLAVMLAFVAWQWYRNTIGACGGLVDDPVTRAHVQQLWKEGRVLVLLRHTDRCRDGDGQTCVDGLTRKGEADAALIGAGIRRLFSDNFELYSSKVDRARATARLAFGRDPRVVPWLRETCGQDLQRVLRQPRAGNQVLVTHGTCLGVLKNGRGEPLIPFDPAGREDHGLAVFLSQPERGGVPKVLACAWPEDWAAAQR